MCFADNIERKMGRILSYKNVRKEKKTTPQKDIKSGKEKKTTPQKDAKVGKRKPTRKKIEDQNNNSESIREEVGETPSSEEETEVPKKN